MGLTPAAIGVGTALLMVIALRTLMTPSAERPAAFALNDDGLNDDGGIVACLDVDRQIVAHKPLAACEGKVVGEAEAKAVRDRRIKRMRTMRAERPSVVPGRVIIGRGTGFFVSDAGHILTNWHVVDGCEAVSAQPVDRPAKVVTVLASDKSLDLALLGSVFAGTGSARFRAPGGVSVGERIAIVGYPLHGRSTIKPIYRIGSVIEPALRVSPVYRRYQVRIDVRRGNSGGPVIDATGLVVGVISAKVNTPVAYRTTGRLIRDVGVAIDPGSVRDFLQQNEVPFRAAEARASRSADAVFAEARGYIAQLTCWH